jgi:hypothetical protein
MELKSSGPMVRDGSLWAPEYIDIALTGSGVEANQVKVWFASNAFLNQYDDYEILVVPPLEPVDTFHDTYANVKAKVALIKWPEILERVETKKNGRPETKVRADTFDWVDKNNRTLKVSTDWTTIIYGAAGDNIDNVKNAIVEYILANTAKTRDEWAVIFPDLFTATEFIITPMWNNYSVPNSGVQAGRYSSITDITEAIATALKTVKGTGYTEAYVQSIISILGYTYKGINLVVVGGPDNRDGINKIKDQFKDYMGISSTNADYLLMSPTTRAWLDMLARMMIIAEEMTPDTTVPQGFTRMARDGVYYVVRTYEKVQYLVVSKYSLNDAAIGFTPILVTGEADALVSFDSSTNLTS